LLNSTNNPTPNKPNQKPKKPNQMKNTLTTSQAAHILIDDENARWSRAGAFALVEHLEQMEEECGQEIEFDRVALRCDWSEYDSLGDWAEAFFGGIHEACAALRIGATHDGLEDDTIREYINDHGQLIEFDGGVIVSSF
jgi:hypothetical protein